MPVVEKLGGALFGAILQPLFAKFDSRPVLDYFRGIELNEKLLKKLKRKLLSINALVHDAELKQISNSYVKAWLDDVRDALLDAEDLLAEIDFELTKCKMEAEYQTSASKVRRMIEILDELESLSNQKDDLGLKISSSVEVGSGSVSKVSQKLPSTSSVVESVFYGRDDDKKKIFNWLTYDTDTDNHCQLSIFSIVGMGGMGKTTLAQHVYSDPGIGIQGKFHIKAWVCVSDEFDVFKVTRAILEAITGKTDDSRDLGMVQGRLEEQLTGKRFLLVLDDVWNEDRDLWKRLQTPLNYGVQGSKILATTRSFKVASTMRSNEVLELKQLQEDHSWQVFAKHALPDDNPELDAYLKKEIGMKIV
ncbi:putative disease resistance RPP13-like protein 1, partial [Mucuna pruriens]